MKLLDGKTAMVTGGGKGIGRAICSAFAAQGANVAILDIDLAAAQQAAEEISGAGGGRAIALACDVSSDQQVRAAVCQVNQTFGGLHIVINNAGICYLTNQKDPLDVSDRQWDRTMDINVKGAFYCARAARPYMVQSGYGRIINFSSQAGRNGGIRVSPEYAASKAAVLCLTKSLAKEMGKDGITVNTVSPGLIRSEMTKDMALSNDMVPLGRVGEPEDVADAVVFLASDLARYVTGICLDVNGGTIMV